MNSLKILISAGNSYARHGIGLVLKSASEHTVVFADGSREDIARLVGEIQPDLLIADVSGRRQDWKVIAALAPVQRVLVITDSAVEFRKANPAWTDAEILGCDGHPAEILRWIEDFVRSERSSCKPLQFLPTADIFYDSPAQSISITPREREIMELVRQGCCNKRIARALSISITTVRTHRYKMMAKLGLHNAVEIARYAERLGSPLAN